MKKNSLIIFLIIIFCPWPAFAISALNEGEMKQQTGQSGFSIGINNVVIYNENTSIKISNGDPSSTDFLEFKNVKRLNTYNTGRSDLNSDKIMGHLKIDVATGSETPGGYSKPYLVLECDDWEGKSYFFAETINFSGNDIGSLSINEIIFPEWNIFLGGHSSGVDFELGFKLDIDSIKYNYGDPASKTCLEFSGIHFAGEFTSNTGDNPADPSTWKSSGRFKIGNFEKDKPGIIDIGKRSMDNSPVVNISAPVKGSIRIENIHMGNQDFGPGAIDGINVHRMTIEIPGRDLGNS